jgi:hypothetical protein
MTKKPTRERRESASTLHPGDQAAPGTPGTGENICAECHGTGRVHGRACDNCGGTGKVITGIGGG